MRFASCAHSPMRYYLYIVATILFAIRAVLGYRSNLPCRTPIESMTHQFPNGVISYLHQTPEGGFGERDNKY